MQTSQMSFLRKVCSCMERIAPLSLAEKWDNVGLLLEAPDLRPSAGKSGISQKSPRKSILLTIDLTGPVAEEAISLGSSIIISYHPAIFHPLRSLTLSNPKQHSLLLAVQNGISIYCPHTALDNVFGGINDWIARGLAGAEYETKKEEDLHVEGNVSVIEEKIGSNGQVGGFGRILKLQKWVGLEEIILRAKAHLGLERIQVARPLSTTPSDVVKTIAICAGSGSSLSGVKADVYFTGEMQHHEVLAAVASGTSVILCGHTNTERGYLKLLQKKLQEELSTELQSSGGFDDQVEILISEKDRHPLEIV